MDNGLETFERGPALTTLDAALPAATYNLTRILLADSRRGCVFVPIRSMQYMAVIDREEIIFVDSQYKRWVEVAWRHFAPQARAALDDPVAYQAVFYTPDGRDLQRRIQADFHKAITLLQSRRPAPGEAHVLPLRREEGD